MLWFKNKKKTIASTITSNEGKRQKKLEKKTKKKNRYTEIEVEKEVITSFVSIEDKSQIQYKVQLCNYPLQPFQQHKVFKFVPITLFIQDCLNTFCIEKLHNILQALPRNSEVFLESPYLIDSLQYQFPDILFNELPNLSQMLQVHGHFVTTIHLPTIDIELFIKIIAKIFQFPSEVYLIYCGKKIKKLDTKYRNISNNFFKKLSSKFTLTKRKKVFNLLENLEDTPEHRQINTQLIQNIFNKFYTMPFFCPNNIFLIYTNNLAQKMLQLQSNLVWQWTSNFLPLLLSDDICFLSISPTINSSYLILNNLESDIKEYLKLYKLLKIRIKNNEKHIFFYKVIESHLMLYYAKLIIENRLDKLEKFDSFLQKNYFVFYIGLIEHSSKQFIYNLRKKHYKSNLFIQYSAKKILSKSKKFYK